MRMIILGILLIAVGAAYFAPVYLAPTPLPADFHLGRAILTTVLGLWVLLEGVVALRSQQLKSDSKAGEEERQRLTGQVKQLEAKWNEERLAREKDQARLRELQTGFDETQARLEAVQRQEAAREQPAEREIVGLLSLLQAKGRFIDFLMDDVARYGDAQIGAAARVVHQGCRSVVQEFFAIEPLAKGQEGADLTLDADYDAKRFRLLGQVEGEPPYKGRLLHRGWRARDIKLPKATGAEAESARGIIAPAEVEVEVNGPD